MAAVLAALVAIPYFHSRLDDEIATRIRAKFAAAYPQLVVRLRSAHLVEGHGIEVRGLSISDPKLTGPRAELAYFDEVLLSCQTDVQELVQHEPQVSRICIRRPIFRPTRVAGGGWSTAKLFPLPKFSEKPPTATIENGTVEIVDSSSTGATQFALRELMLSLKPSQLSALQGSHALGIKGAFKGDHVGRVDVSGVLNPDDQSLALEGAVSGLALGPEVLRVLPVSGKTLDLVGALRGEMELSFKVQKSGAAGAPLLFNVDGRIVRGRVDDARLPYPITDLRASVHFDERGFAVRDVTARCGPSTLRVAMFRHVGYAAGAPLSINASCSRLQLDQQLADVLPKSLQQHWYKFLPAGEVDGDLALTFDGKIWSPRLNVKCINVSFTYHKFPYRLQQGTGTVELRGQELELHLIGYSGSQMVNVDGQFKNPGADFTGELLIRGESLPCDEKLLAALPDKSGPIVRSLNPRGQFDVNARFWREDFREPVHQQLRVELKRCSITYEKFAYPLSNVRGTIEMTDGIWKFHDLEGTNDTGLVTGYGHMSPDGPDHRLVLYFTGKKVALEQELCDALPPNVQRLWTYLRPRGNADLKAEVLYFSRDKQLTVDLRASPYPESTSIEPECFPYRFEKLRGSIHYVNGRADFKDLHAVHGRTTLSTDGWCDVSPDGAWTLQLSDLRVDHLRPDHDLIAALPDGLRKTVTTLRPSGGDASLRGNLAFAKQTGLRSPLRANWDVVFDLPNVQVECGVKLDSIWGSVRLVGQCEGDKFESDGELSLDSVIYKGHQFTHVRGPFWIDGARVIIGSGMNRQEPGPTDRHVTANLYGGKVLADCQVMLTAIPHFDLRASLASADLAQITQENLRDRQTLQGKIAATLELHGTASGAHTLSGGGEARLFDANVYELPLMVALLKILSVRPPDTTAFTESNVDFRVQGEHLLFNKIDFMGDAVSLRGQGWMDLDKRVNLTFYAEVGRNRLRDVPVLGRVLGEASQQIMQIQVDGTLDDPNTTATALPVVSQALQELQAELQGMNGRAVRPSQNSGLPKATNIRR